MKRVESIDNVISVFLYILVFCTPLIFVTNTNELFEFPKMYFVYIVGSTTILLAYLRRILVNETTRLKGTTTALLVFLFLNALSTLLSTHLYTSLWGYFSRFNGGMISVLVFFGIYLVFVNNKSTSIKITKELTILTTLPIGSYGIYQHYFTDTVRVYSTIGQPNWLAAYLIMVIPLILSQIALGGNNKKPWAVLLVLSYVTLWLTFSTSGLLAFIVSVIFWVILNKQAVLEKRKVFVFLTLVCLTYSATNPGIYRDKVKDLFLETRKTLSYQLKAYAQSDSYIKGPELNYEVSDTAYIRKWLNKGTLDIIFSSPKNFLIGTGPETFTYVFANFRPSELNFSSEWDFIFNKPHNYYLEIWSDRGILVLFAYVLILTKAILQKDTSLAPAITGLAITNLFGWPTVATSILFWIYLGIIAKQKT